MRFSQDKVKDLAAQIVAMLEENPKIHTQVESKALGVAVGSVILDNLREEDDIDREVDELLRQHDHEIDAEDLDVETLRRKFRQEIARQRGFVM